jgi:hypothetical protein
MTIAEFAEHEEEMESILRDREMTLEAEVRLIRWSESSTAGRTITIELPPDAGDGHPFKGFPTGHAHGQRFKMKFVPIGDDETEIPGDGVSGPPQEHDPGIPQAIPRTPAEVSARRSALGKERYYNADPMDKAMMRAGILAGDPKFWEWAETHSTVGVQRGVTVYDKESAADFIHLVIKASRSCIATDPEVFQRYRDLIETPYRMWAGLMAEPR